MSGDLIATTTVTVELTGRRPTIGDVQEALDTFKREGIPDTFDVEIEQREDRKYVDGVPFDDREVEFVFRVEARRAAVAR